LNKFRYSFKVHSYYCVPLSLTMSRNYQHIREICGEQTKLSKTVIDDFLIYFAANKSKLHKEFKRTIQPYRHITREMPQGWEEMLASQYIAHRIFNSRGLILKYLNHSGLGDLSSEEKAFLEIHSRTPWRYSFARIVGRPESDFFEMEDVLTGDHYLLYSPGITSILLTENPLIWFNLIGFNGECWQTYGPILYFNGFEAQDIIFFASEANGDWYINGEEVMEDLEENPVPFSMLISGSNLPLVYHGSHQVVANNAEYEIKEPFDSAHFKSDFRIEYSHDVYKLSLKGWDEFPHYSTAFYDEKARLLFLYAMTDSGFKKLVDVLNGLGFTLEYTPDERVNMCMLTTASRILKRELSVNRYDRLFTTDTAPEEQQSLNQMNALLAELIPYINSRKTPDLDTLATKYGVDLEEVKEIYQMVKKSVE